LYTIKENDIFIEISHYHLKNDNPNTIDDEFKRERDTTAESIMRSKRLVIEYALNNPWTHFFTITLDKKRVGDRTAYQKMLEKLLLFFKNQKIRNNNELGFLVIAEPHKRIEQNGKQAVHFHGLIYIEKNNKLDFGSTFTYQNKKGQTVYCNESSKIRKSFGINTFTQIYNTKEYVAYYVSKYINKSFIDNIKILDKRFYKSQGLKLSESAQFDDLKEFHGLGVEPTYKNQFTTKWRITKEEYQFYKENGILPSLD